MKLRWHQRTVVWLVENPLCWVAHRLWWTPFWNRSLLMSCPTLWFCNHSKTFNRWFEQQLTERAASEWRRGRGNQSQS